MTSDALFQLGMGSVGLDATQTEDLARPGPLRGMRGVLRPQDADAASCAFLRASDGQRGSGARAPIRRL